MSTQNQTISWTAPEFRYYEKNVGWYVTFIIIVVLLVGFFVYEHDLFAAICIAIIAIFTALFSSQKPKIVSIELTNKEVKLGVLSLPYKQLRYFWVVNNQNHKTLNLQTSTVINNTIIIELLEQNEDEIRQYLLPYLPEHQQTHETFAQRMSHKFKF
jgi:hypothetical protein